MTANPQTGDKMMLPPDAYVGLALAGAIALEALSPLSLLPPAGVVSVMTAFGLVLAIAGISLEIAAARALSLGGTTTRPNGAATALVTGGVFSRSRNPFYLGILLLISAVMVAFSLDWGVVFLPLLWLALDRLVVPVEERRLERAFGQHYLDYAGATRRWL